MAADDRKGQKGPIGVSASSLVELVLLVDTSTFLCVFVLVIVKAVHPCCSFDSLDDKNNAVDRIGIFIMMRWVGRKIIGY